MDQNRGKCGNVNNGTKRGQKVEKSGGEFRKGEFRMNLGGKGSL